MLLKRGGEIILLFPCYEGIGPHVDQFMELANLDTLEILNRIKKGKIEDIMGASEVILLNSMKDKCKITIVS